MIAWNSGSTPPPSWPPSAQVSCRDALEAHLHRVDAINGGLNAVTVILDHAAD